MFEIYTETIDFDMNSFSDIIIAMAQIPVDWIENENFVVHKDPEKQWNLVKETLEELKKTKFQGRNVDIAVFPELSVPHKYVDKLTELVNEFDTDFILLAGFDFIPLEKFVELLNSSDVSKKKEQIELLTKSSDYEHIKKMKPVNFCSIVVKSGGKVKQYFQSKLFPSVYEQKGSRFSEILHGNYLLHFKKKPEENKEEKDGKTKLREFSFLPLICFDQIYEKTEAGLSVIEELIKHSGDEGAPGFMFILQFNPQMNHTSIDDALYEYYLCMPTRHLRELTYTLFTNVSERSKVPDKVSDPVFGSLAVFNKKAILTNTDEYNLTKMGRGNLQKMKFLNTSDRLYFLKCSLLFNYQEDARSSRNPIEILQTTEYKEKQWKYVVPKKVNSTSFYSMIDQYCSDEFISYFEDGTLANRMVIDELHENELLVIFSRGYEHASKENIPNELIEKMGHLAKRLDKLEAIKKDKLRGIADEIVENDLYNIGSFIQQNREIIKSIVKKW